MGHVDKRLGGRLMSVGVFTFPFRLGGAFSAVTFEHRLDRDDEDGEDTDRGDKGERGFQHGPRIRCFGLQRR